MIGIGIFYENVDVSAISSSWILNYAYIKNIYHLAFLQGMKKRFRGEVAEYIKVQALESRRPRIRS